MAANSERARRICSIINGFYANHAALSHRGGEPLLRAFYAFPIGLNHRAGACCRWGDLVTRNSALPSPDRCTALVGRLGLTHFLTHKLSRWTKILSETET